MTTQYTNTPTETREIRSVSDINQQLKQAISTKFCFIWVEGEISNLARPASGHIYFSLKDKKAQIRCAMFRNSNNRVTFDITNGLQVVVRANASVYEARGDLQLIVDSMEEAGFGALQRQFEALKKKLYLEGLFDEQRKQSIPQYPTEIAIITSPSGAAIKDFINVAHRRYPSCKKNIYSVPVQGEQASEHIGKAVKAINRHARADIIVLIRGGGSIEDLWCFNDEALARTIVESEIPVITGIGHEIDYTIADFVADLRAPTPSVAAELSCPDAESLVSSLASYQQVLSRTCMELLHRLSQSTDWLSQRLQRAHPTVNIATQKQSLNQLLARLQKNTSQYFKNSLYKFESIKHRHRLQSPQHIIKSEKAEFSKLNVRLTRAISLHLEQKQHQFQLYTKTMQAVSPLNTLQRGYSITATHADRQVLTHSNDLKHGDQLITYLAGGEVVSSVESTSSTNFIDSILNPKDTAE